MSIVKMQEPDLRNMDVELKSMKGKDGAVKLKLTVTAEGCEPDVPLDECLAKYVMARYAVHSLAKDLGLDKAA